MGIEFEPHLLSTDFVMVLLGLHFVPSAPAINDRSRSDLDSEL
jgi:hypothetical protein